jgi:SAM-dependent methyltransferase
MGLDINSVQFLLAARKRAVEFGDVLMIGRQQLMVYPAKVRQVLVDANIPADLFSASATDTDYAEPLFKALGARTVRSLDVSSFEGAEVLHDLNKPLPDKLKQQFDLVYDGGTLEHVFNFPVALQNCMELLRPGGYLFLDTIANNWCGHGFYQFSPELFFSALSEENGFSVEQMIAHAVGPYNRWLEVSDPRKIRSRIELITWYPVNLKIRARRAKVVPIFANAPQQSDYVPRWTDQAKPGAQPEEAPALYAPSRPKLAKVLPRLARLFGAVKTGWTFWRTMSIHNRKNFRPVKKV